MQCSGSVSGWRLGALALALSISSSPPAGAYESDVHYGLTLWLAMRAGFDRAHAEAIALANQRVDGGAPETQTLNLEYACAGRMDQAARQFQASNFPSASLVPDAPQSRMVEAGGKASRQALNALADQLPGKEGLLAAKFGEALHILQDSWSNQGVPSAPDFADALACDLNRFSGAPVARGGPASHVPSMTFRWVDDTIAMAQATYGVLIAYPTIDQRARRPEAWDTLEPAIRSFALADTKTRKRDWFAAQGISDTGFLQATTLPDGPDPGPLQWLGWKFPLLQGNASNQHDAAPDIREFFDGLLARWFDNGPVEKIVEDFGSHAAQTPSAHAIGAGRELSARLKVWRLHDHGAVAELAHVTGPYSTPQRRKIDKAARDARRGIAAMSTAQAVFPLLPVSTTPAPLVPYIVRVLPQRAGRDRALAILRLRHAPYDTVGLIAERERGEWKLVRLVSTVN